MLIKGPTLLKVIGECEILGVKFRNTIILYNNNKYLPIEKDTDTIIKVKKDSNYIDVGNNENYSTNRIGTAIWSNIITNILNTNRKRIIIIGSSDTGKSTLTLYLANKLISEGYKPLIIDSDIGQGELAPPACIGAKILTKQTIDLAKSNPNRINFIGNIQPIGYELRIINCIKKIYNRLNRHDSITIINTDGYIGNNKRNYKINLIEKVKPDCIICMGEEEENIKNDFFFSIRNKFKNYSNLHILQGQSPSKEIQKSFFERREKRLKKYSILLKTFTKNFNIHKQKLISVYYKNKFFFIHNIPNTKIQRTETRNDHLENILNNKSLIRDRFVGLSLNYDYEKIIGFGLIKDFTNSYFIMQSSINKFDHIFLSDIKLSLERNYSYQ
jgi:polynucleotide 5'-hydroxyl-kinase GRC3/NOL9